MWARFLVAASASRNCSSPVLALARCSSSDTGEFYSSRSEIPSAKKFLTRICKLATGEATK